MRVRMLMVAGARKRVGGFSRGLLLCWFPRFPFPLSLLGATGGSKLTRNSAFMSIATYLIFGSWLNYNRYGARGWDLLPHGDTIRDVPYLIKDWSRRVFNTVQDSGSRGGYAAV